MALSKSDIRQRVGEDLGLTALGQSLENQDKARIDATYDEVYSYIKSKGLAVWASTADIPDTAVPFYILMMLEKLLVSYSVPESRYVRIMSAAGPNGDVALANLAEATTPDYEDTEAEVDY